MASLVAERTESAYSAGDPGLIPGLGRSPGEGNGNPRHYSCLENPMDRGAWRATVHGVTKSQTQWSDFTFFHYYNRHHPGPYKYQLSSLLSLNSHSKDRRQNKYIGKLCKLLIDRKNVFGKFDKF